MIRIVFKNLERSELAKEAVENQLSNMVERFPDLEKSTLHVTLSMDNSPRQAGPDLFRVKIRISGSKYHGLILEKEAPSLYSALRDVHEHLLELLNRRGDKVRTKTRARERNTLFPM